MRLAEAASAGPHNRLELQLLQGLDCPTALYSPPMGQPLHGSLADGLADGLEVVPG